MYTRSIIQQTVEAMMAKDNFRTAIAQLMEKYNIEDSVFIMNRGALNEVVAGYFVTEGEYSSLEEAVSACDLNSMGIRVMGNTFQTGKIHNRLSECAEGKKVFDLNRLENIR